MKRLIVGAALFMLVPSYQALSESPGNLKVVAPSGCNNLRTETIPSDRKAGTSCLKISWDSTRDKGGPIIKKPLAAANLTGKMFSLYVKPLNGNLSYLNIGTFKDEARIERHTWYATPAGEWTCRKFSIGVKTTENSFEKDPGLDNTQVAEINVWLGGRENEHVEVLIDDLRESTDLLQHVLE